MQNLRRKYPQAIKKQDVDAIIHVRQAEKHLQDMKRASCRYIDLKKSICNSEYQGSVDTSAAKRVSATEHIKVLQIHQLPKEHLRQQIIPGYRYIRFQKSKSLIAPLISITVHLQERKDYAIQRIGVGLARRS